MLCHTGGVYISANGCVVCKRAAVLIGHHMGLCVHAVVFVIKSDTVSLLQSGWRGVSQQVDGHHMIQMCKSYYCLHSVLI